MSRIVKPDALHIQAYRIIMNSILEGEYQPSERLVEARLAGELGISRGPIREAIRMLIQDGLLVYNDGLVKVYQPTVKDVVEIFQCREALETLAITLAIDHYSEKLEQQLLANLKEARETHESQFTVKLGQLDQQFHDIIITASKNNHLIELLSRIKTKIHYMRNSMIKDDFYPSFVDEHEQILRALRAKDKESATSLLKTHIRKGLDGVLQHTNE